MLSQPRGLLKFSFSIIEKIYKFQVRQPQFVPCKCSSLLLCSKPVQENCLLLSILNILKSFQTQCAIYGLAKLNLLLEMRLYQIIFNQEEIKIQNIKKGPSFGALRRVLTCLIILSLRKTHICAFSDYFSFSHFLGTSCCFQISKLSSLIR